jgi:hypothetical protein
MNNVRYIISFLIIVPVFLFTWLIGIIADFIKLKGVANVLFSWLDFLTKLNWKILNK